jgi:hypothetical protein
MSPECIVTLNSGRTLLYHQRESGQSGGPLQSLFEFTVLGNVISETIPAAGTAAAAMGQPPRLRGIRSASCNPSSSRVSADDP